ncbi:hypothetical protein [Streptomyces fulvorobeus]|uniref:hypothetical protein n=1 Tax=Streptomyces fulvorobeus TaxID=284028 RepID=UPI0015677161|nr:hypothetical protein [Streptomyces fulvorobeus]
MQVALGGGQHHGHGSAYGQVPASWGLRQADEAERFRLFPALPFSPLDFEGDRKSGLGLHV